jgi:hypothetical protein
VAVRSRKAKNQKNPVIHFIFPHPTLIKPPRKIIMISAFAPKNEIRGQRGKDLKGVSRMDLPI